MPSRVFLCFMLLVFWGCKYNYTEMQNSEVLTESATVVDLVYVPSRHGSGVGPTIDLTGGGGMGVAITGVDIPEKYAIVFQCQHGKFIIENDQGQAKDLWNRLREGQEVVGSYREMYQTRWEKDGNKKRFLERRLVDYDFLDAK